MFPCYLLRIMHKLTHNARLCQLQFVVNSLIFLLYVDTSLLYWDTISSSSLSPTSTGVSKGLHPDIPVSLRRSNMFFCKITILLLIEQLQFPEIIKFPKSFFSYKFANLSFNFNFSISSRSLPITTMSST